MCGEAMPSLGLQGLIMWQHEDHMRGCQNVKCQRRSLRTRPSWSHDVGVLLAWYCIFGQIGPLGTAAHNISAPPSPVYQSQGPLVVSVTTGEELQQAFRDRARHIVINDHLDLTALPLFSANTITTTAVGVIVDGTDTIRGNCTTPSHHTSLQPKRQSDRQCVLDVFEDFVELQKPNLWLHDIYLRLIGDSTKDHATYFGAHNGNLWLTQCVMRGDGFRARAVDTHTPWKGYARDTIFSRFSKDSDAVWRFQQGTTAAFARCNFTDNVIPTGAQGSVIGARAIEGQTYVDPSYIWVQECTFSGNQPEEAAVIRVHHGSWVYSDAPGAVAVYDSSRSAVTLPWLFRRPTPADNGGPLFNTSMFLTERDPWFADSVLDQTLATGLPEVERFFIPPVVVALRPELGSQEHAWRRGQILATALILCASLCAAIITATSVLVAYIQHTLRTRRRLVDGSGSSFLKPCGSSHAPAELAAADGPCAAPAVAASPRQAQPPAADTDDELVWNSVRSLAVPPKAREPGIAAAAGAAGAVSPPGQVDR